MDLDRSCGFIIVLKGLSAGQHWSHAFAWVGTGRSLLAQRDAYALPLKDTSDIYIGPPRS
jgi:hypothetical protein